ncbi:MAG: glycoside hydrolase family 55 protein [Treponema sp.]|nr:glycoside hydrolase family 55 protein [Treponema sp.]
MRKKTRSYLLAAVLLGTAFLASCPNPGSNNKKPGTLKDFSAGPVLVITAGDKTISYSWVPSDPAADSYDLYWTEGDFTDAAEVKAGAVIIGAVSGGTIEGLDNDCIYSVAVTAKKEGYNPVDSAVQSAMPASGEGLAENFSSGPVLEITAGDGTISYSWTEADPAADSYDLYWREGDFTNATDVKAGTKLAGAVSGGTIGSLVNNSSYSVVITARKEGYNPIDSAVKTAMPESPDNPREDFAAAPVLEITGGNGTISYSWTSSDPQADSYDLYYIDGDFSDATDVKTGTKITDALSGGTINDLVNNCIYSVVLKANKEGYNSIDSDVQTATPKVTYLLFTAEPGLSLTGSDNKITVTWTDSDPVAESYDVYWREGIYTNAANIKMGNKVTGANSGYEISSISAGQSYSVVVTANKAGYSLINSEPVIINAFTAKPVLSLSSSDKKLTVSWTDSDPVAESYDIYWITGTYSAAANVKTGTKVTGAASGYEIDSLAENQSYSVAVTANKANYFPGDSNVKTEKISTSVFDPNYDYSGPGNITFSDEGIIVTPDTVTGANSYEIWRSGSRLGTYTLIDTVTSTAAWTDPNPNPVRYENYYKIVAKNGATTLSEKVIALEIKIFGANTYFYDSKYDAMSAITGEINSIHDTVTGAGGGHWTNNRYAFYFKPGTYNYSTAIKIGFYTSVNGLGAVPTDTKLMNTVQCPAYLNDNNVTQNFWRSIENLSVQGGSFTWSVSQAAPARRMHSTRSTVFNQNGGWASGGFLCDSYFTGSVEGGSQQQFYARNCHFTSAFSGVGWNKTVQGSSGNVENDTSSATRTKIDTTPVIREKPFLYFDSGLNEYMVFVPALKKDAVGVSWTASNIGDGYSLILVKDFYIAKPTDTAATINAALDAGKHIYFLPGRFELSVPLRVKHPNTILLGSGYTTLIPANGNTYGAVFVDDVDGVTVASLMFDALYNSTYLICAGESGANNDHSANPTLLADIFLRIGGVRANCNADISALINSNNVIGDHFWAWRADHGTGVGWTSNKTKNGVVVTGDNVTMYGLFVEHFHEYETLWLGENGRTYFYQNEAPYDPPNQSSYMSHNNTVNGWASYKVANSVNHHYAAGMGSYSVFNNTVIRQNPYEVPNKADVIIKNACTHHLKNGSYGSIVNGAGAGNPPNGRVSLTLYQNGTATGVSDGGPTTGTQPADETFNLPTNLHP